MATLKQDIDDGKIKDTRDELNGFEREVTSKGHKKHTPEQLAKEKLARAKRKKDREEVEEAQAKFQALKTQLKAEGKL